MLSPRLSDAAANAAADAVCALLNSGYLRLYSGSQPATPNTSVTTQTLLAELRFGATAFAGAVAGMATANPLTPDASAAASGSATWFRALEVDGTTAVFDGSVGTNASNLTLNSVAIASGAAVSISDFIYTQAVM